MWSTQHYDAWHTVTGSANMSAQYAEGIVTLKYTRCLGIPFRMPSTSRFCTKMHRSLVARRTAEKPREATHTIYCHPAYGDVSREEGKGLVATHDHLVYGSRRAQAMASVD